MPDTSATPQTSKGSCLLATATAAAAHGNPTTFCCLGRPSSWRRLLWHSSFIVLFQAATLSPWRGIFSPYKIVSVCFNLLVFLCNYAWFDCSTIHLQPAMSICCMSTNGVWLWGPIFRFVALRSVTSSVYIRLSANEKKLYTFLSLCLSL